MKKIKLSIFLIILSILCLSIYIFTKTHDYKSITQITFVNSIGLEYNEETSNFTMYFFVLNNYTIAQTGNSASFTNTHAYVSKGSDKEILLSENKIRNNSNTKFDLSHIRSFIIHDSFFVKNNAYLLLEYFINNPKYNPSFEIYMTKDKLDEIYKLENFSEVSGYYTILVNTQNNIPVKHITYNDFCNDLLIPNYTKYYQRIKLNKGIISDDEKEYISLEFDGVSFINNEYILSSFKYSNLYGLGYFTTKINRPFIINHNEISYSFLPNNFTIKKKIKNNNIYLYIKIDGCYSNCSYLNNDKQIEILETSLKKDIIKMHDTLNNYDIDFFNVTYTNKNYNYKKSKLIFDFDININKKPI